MAKKRDGEFVIEDAKILFPNFRGVRTKYKPAGYRNFLLLLDDQQAREVEALGYNVKQLKSREIDDEVVPGDYYVEVKVGYNDNDNGESFGPRVVLISGEDGKNRLDLTRDTVNLLDTEDIRTWDVCVRPYDWNVEGNSGRKAYLRKLYATLEEDELDLKYER